MDEQEDDYQEPRRPGDRLHPLTLKDLAVFGLNLMFGGLMFVLLIAIIAAAVWARRH